MTASYSSKHFLWKALIIKPWPCWQDSLLLTDPGIYPEVYHKVHVLWCLFVRGSKTKKGLDYFKFHKKKGFFISYIIQVIILQCGSPSCTFPKKVFLFPSVWARREYIWKLNWKKSLLIYFENCQGTPCSHKQSRNRMMNTFVIFNITPTWYM